MPKLFFRWSILFTVALALALPADAQTRRKTTRKPAASAAQKKKTVRKRPSKKPSRSARARRRAGPVIAPVLFTAPRSAGALSADLGAITGRIRNGRFGVMVTSLSRRDTLFALNAGVPMRPASTMKLLTSAIAFERFGPTYRFSTDALREGDLGQDGTLRGNIIIRGDGDPAFSGRYLGGGPAAAVNRLAEMVAAAGVRHVTGDVIGDATGFDQQRIPDGWLTRYLQAGYAARVSALSINENLVWVTISPQGVALEPSTSSVRLVNSVRIVGGAGARISIRRQTDGSIIVGGTMGNRAGTRRYVYVIEDPAAFTTGAFRNALIARGITIGGVTKLAPTPPSAVRIASHASPTLDRLVAAMNRESINHFAELIFRNGARGIQRDTQGSARNAQSALRKLFAEKVRTDTTMLFFADGSGLSTMNRVTARAMTQMLGYSHTASWGPWFHASLPVAGESELLRRRMRGGQTQGNLHAKTGTTNDVVGLAGYVTAINGEVIAFSFIYNGNDRSVARSVIDAMGQTLANFSR